MFQDDDPSVFLAGIDLGLGDINWGGLFDLNGKLNLPALQLPGGGLNLDFLGGLGFDLPGLDLGGISLPNLDFLGSLEQPSIPIPFITNCGGGLPNLDLPNFDLGFGLDFLGLLGEVRSQVAMPS